MNEQSKIERAIEDLRNGKLIIVADDADREAEGDLVGLSELVTHENVNFMTKYGRGLICVPITEKRAVELDLDAMSKNNTDTYGTQFTVSVDHYTNSTGISTADRADTIRALADPLSKTTDFKRPGHMFPLIAKNAGVLERRGHTEAAVDLASLSNSFPSAYICEILNDDGSMARYPALETLAKQWHLTLITVEDLVQYRKKEIAIEN
ncbi:3,4-dihydroxy-2-butanone 4-phosphate synthase [Oceanobacillus sp. E9]|uniref:3,4-dihydroxy-2-butanone 4-phosphate synthase n=1 Tax=Oceanobacillus kimchii TaxID=746691 RepID=A0ABQ5TQI1_9BACI|nr:MULTISPECIES: 3,4-dihydroxy-2-butanone-4-phosphate synthase [Oceanobacillus]MBT2599681.1 3,4-dihydroxy-2-butanone-4-phosphate synthase [Oceanobacillus sp. ISL-74]OEH56228.1 3,4-dihydroxy-2-butanone 4-phosphate synthase [Oceanobacillus sp. E9]GLO67909.1 hypothetical protein MACH08_36930 [Oceanobacillus kimchii]